MALTSNWGKSLLGTGNAHLGDMLRGVNRRSGIIGATALSSGFILLVPILAIGLPSAQLSFLVYVLGASQSIGLLSSSIMNLWALRHLHVAKSLSEGQVFVRTSAGALAITITALAVLSFWWIPATGDLLPSGGWAYLVIAISAFTLEYAMRNHLINTMNAQVLLVTSTIAFVGGVPMVILGSIGGIAWAIVGLLSYSAIFVTTSSIFLRRRFAKETPTGQSNQVARKGVQVIVPTAMNHLLSTPSPLIVSSLVLILTYDGAEAAMFLVGLQWFNVSLFMAAAVSKITLPELFRAIGSGGTSEAVRKMVIAATKFSVSWTILSALVVTLSLPLITNLYSFQSDGLGFVIAVFVAAAIVNSLHVSLTQVLPATGQLWRYVSVTAMWLITMILVVVIFGSRHGAVAGAFGFLAAHVVHFGVMFRFYRRGTLLKTSDSTQAARLAN